MSFGLRDVVDILIVAYVIYRVIDLIQGTRATTLVKGLAVVFASSVLARALNLRTISWLLERIITLVLVALPVVFYPELRRALEQLGRGRLFSGFGKGPQLQQLEIEQIVQAVAQLSAEKIGALLVLERQMSLKEYARAGVALDALLSKELLINIFEPGGPLHDGAVIISEGRVVSAINVLPLSEGDLGSHLGTRHRAAVGISEQTDAVVIVVSEQTGTISLAVGGRLRRYLNEARLTEQLAFYWRREDDLQ